MRSTIRGIVVMAFVFSNAGCLIDDECVLEPSNGQPAIPADIVPRAIDPEYRIVSPEVRAYLEGRVASMKILATTVTRRGQVYDWIDPRDQVPGGVLATPPPLDPEPDPSAPGSTCRPKGVRGELEDEPEAWGPPGSVPVLRIDPDSIYAPGTVDDFLSRYGDAADIPSDVIPPQVSAADYHYRAMARQWIENFGAEAYLNVWQPYSQYLREFSLGEIGVFAVDGNNAIRETIETGWIVYAGRYGYFNTRLFVYFTTTGYKENGPNKGGYDKFQDGWVQTSPTIAPGMVLTEISASGGEQVEAYFRIELSDGHWWVRFRDEFIGYYPASMYTPSGLGTQASGVQFQGETYDDPAIEGMTVTDMGTGAFPRAEAKRRSAYMRYMQYQASTVGYDRKTVMPPSAYATNPKCYSFIDNTTATDDWHSQFYYGGPGQNPDCP